MFLADGALAGDWTLIGWNDLGMHCMDKDFAVFATLPPYNTIHAQLIDANGQLVTNATGITVTYEAVADPQGSINTTSQGKTNFWDHVLALFGVSPPPDHGLAGFAMPGPSNIPQAMEFDPSRSWFTAEGIPLTPYDDSSAKNYYPMMRLVARDANGQELASTQIVLPISDEMTCKACHASGSSPAAEPSAGWVYDPDPERDYRLNILLLHDEYQLGDPLFAIALAARGYDAAGLYPTATEDGTAILCSACHGSNALPGTGYAGIEMLTEAMHSLHAGVVDPATGLTLGSSLNRSACYRCHPGSETRCLRGAMGDAVAADGSLAMQCQSCHGAMAAVGDPARQGWFDEPKCQSCHTGTATHNNGQIRYVSVFDSDGQPRVSVDETFATSPDVPAPGFSLYRFSTGHGGLQCEACHGSPHAIFPTSHVNDNVQSILLQGHKGKLVECATCHGQQPRTTAGGPHGMHPVGQTWVSRHSDAAEGGSAACQACHGTDYRGTVLSYAQGDRALSTPWGSKTFWRGFQIGCYTCHNGPRSESGNPNHAPVTSSLSITTSAGAPVAVTLVGSDADGDQLSFRVVDQGSHGTVGLVGTTATYYPESGFSGADAFTYAAWDGSTDSNLSTVAITVAGGVCTVGCSASVPANATAGTAVTFTGQASPSGCSGEPTYDWDFGDGSPHVSTASASHAYAAAGTYTWTFTATADGVFCTKTGTISVSGGGTCTVACSASVPANATAGTAVTFTGQASPSGCSGEPTYDWDFGDGSPHASTASASHAYATAGTYTWTFTATADGVSCTRSGTIAVESAATCTLTCSAEVPSRARRGESVDFHGHVETDQCSGEPTLSWSFGDGEGAIGYEVRHRYDHRGTFTWHMSGSLSGATCSTTGTISIGGRERQTTRH